MQAQVLPLDQSLVDRCVPIASIQQSIQVAAIALQMPTLQNMCCQSRKTNKDVVVVS
jgi:hypothetical protein